MFKRHLPSAGDAAGTLAGSAGGARWGRAASPTRGRGGLHPPSQAVREPACVHAGRDAPHLLTPTGLSGTGHKGAPGLSRDPVIGSRGRSD